MSFKANSGRRRYVRDGRWWPWHGRHAHGECGHPACGNHCISLYPQKYGPHYYVDVYQQRAVAGDKVILFQGSNSDPALDFTFKFSGTVNSFYTSYGLVAGRSPTPTAPTPLLSSSTRRTA